MKIDWEKHTYGTCRTLSKVPKNATITHVNDNPVIALCEYCGEPIMLGEKHGYGDNGAAWHPDCKNSKFTILQQSEVIHE